MPWRWSDDKPFSWPTRDNYLYHFTNVYLVSRVDAISLDLNTPKFDHTAKAIIAHMAFTLSYLKSTFSDLSSKQGSVNLSGRLCPGDTPTPRISILVRWHLYIEPCPNNQTFGIKFKVFVCQQCYIKHYNTPSEGCWHVTPLSMQRRNAIM